MSMVNLNEDLIQRSSNANLMIKDLLNEYSKRHEVQKTLYNEYRGEVDILRRQLSDPSKINKTLNHDFRSFIVDQVVGYMFGKPITYSLNPESFETDGEYQENHALLQYYNEINNVSELDSETGKYAGICGYAGRLHYIDTSGRERACLVPPWECIFVENQMMSEVQMAVRYFDVYVQDGEKLHARTKVELYDQTHVATYQQNKKGDYELKGRIPHMFQEIPLIRFQNNAEELGDFEKVRKLIDAYDVIVSDCQNEIEEFRLAYLLLTGAEMDEDVLLQARQTGVIELPEGADAKYLTKAMSGEFIQEHLKGLKENIHRFSRSVDMSDESFSGGGMSGEARKWKILALENKAITKERKFYKALRDSYRVLSTAWEQKEYKIDYTDVEMQFHRNLPVDLMHYAEVSTKLKGNISERTRLEQLPFIGDVDQELKRMIEEQDRIIDLYQGVTDEEE